MSLKLLFASNVVDAHFDADNAWLYWDWKGPQNMAEVQATCWQMIPYVEQTGARKLLNDHTHVTEVNYGLDAWVVAQYLPELGRAGIERIAWVCCPVLDVRNRTEVAFANNINQPQIAVFDDVATAYTWLGNTPLNKATMSGHVRPGVEY